MKGFTERLAARETCKIGEYDVAAYDTNQGFSSGVLRRKSSPMNALGRRILEKTSVSDFQCLPKRMIS